MKAAFKTRNDRRLNPELRKEVQDLRGLIWKNMPELKNNHFQMSQCLDSPSVLIMDTRTGKISKPIGLCNLRGAIQVLNDLDL